MTISRLEIGRDVERVGVGRAGEDGLCGIEVRGDVERAAGRARRGVRAGQTDGARGLHRAAGGQAEVVTGLEQDGAGGGLNRNAAVHGQIVGRRRRLPAESVTAPLAVTFDATVSGLELTTTTCPPLAVSEMPGRPFTDPIVSSPPTLRLIRMSPEAVLAAASVLMVVWSGAASVPMPFFARSEAPAAVMLFVRAGGVRDGTDGRGQIDVAAPGV